MSRHLKTSVILGLKATCGSIYQLPPNSAPRARGVRYLKPFCGIDFLYGAMNTVDEGRKYHKHIIIRRAPEHNGLLQLYTYHFPKTWSAACVANRELIKEAQRRAHALEHAQTDEALEWRIRFFHHYFTVYKGGAKPAPGLKPYSRFYQYTYVSIYRELQQARDAARQQSAWLSSSGSKPALSASQSDSSALVSDVTFKPVYIYPLNRLRPLRHTPSYRSYARWANPQIPARHENISIFAKKSPKYLHNSKKSSNFAVDFKN